MPKPQLGTKRPTSAQLRAAENLDKKSGNMKNNAMHYESEARAIKNRATGMRQTASKDSAYAEKLHSYGKSDSTAKAERLTAKSNYTKTRAAAAETGAKQKSKMARGIRTIATKDSLASQRLRGKIK